MARIRTIKPEFWSSEQVMNISRDARLLFIGIWNFADDNGIQPASARTLKALIFPGDDFTACEVDKLVAELVDADLLHRYESQNKHYLQVTGWKRHQRIDQPTYKHPLPDGTMPPNPARRRPEAGHEQQVFGEQSANVQQVFGTGKDRIGKERNGVKPLSAQAEPEHVPACPQQKILGLYAESLPELAQPRTWTGQREVNLRSRWRWVLTAKRPDGERYATTDDEGLEYFQRLFGYVRESDFLMGRSGKWQCDLPWLMKAENFAKVIDGKYDNRDAA